MIKQWPQLLFAGNIFLNLTNLFVFAATWLGLSLQLLGMLMLVVNLFYLFHERRLVGMFFRQPVMWVLLLLFYIWPLIAAVPPMFHGYGMAREIVLQTFYMSFMLGTAVFVIRNSYARTWWLLLICFSVSVFGMLLQTYLPSIFYKLASSSSLVGGVFSYGRAGGFFANPNNAARFVILMFIFLCMFPRRLSFWFQFLLGGTTLFAVLLTASRSSLIILAAVFLTIYGFKFAFPNIRERIDLRPERLFLATCVIIVVLIGIGVAAPMTFRYMAENTDAGDNKGMANRLEFFTTGFSGFVEGVEQEAIGRWSTVEPYVEGFKESWMFGRGMAGYRTYRMENRIPLTPHNTIFASWMDYGFGYILVGLLLLVQMLVSRRMWVAQKHMGLLFYPILLICLLGVMFTFDALFTQRGIYVVFGIVVALYCAPPEWFRFDQNASQQPILPWKKAKMRGRRM
jgi:hypothetical protein